MDFTVVGGQLAHLTKLRCFIRKQTKNDKQTKHYQKIVRNLSLSKVTICNKQESHSACNWTPDVTVVVDTMYGHESCNISVCKVHASQNKTLSKVNYFFFFFFCRDAVVKQIAESPLPLDRGP